MMSQTHFFKSRNFCWAGFIHIYTVVDFCFSFVQERHEFLGPDLATAHFVVARGGAVRFKGIDEWFEMNDKEEIGFPRVKIPDMFVEAIDVSGTSMMYQSFDNYGKHAERLYMYFNVHQIQTFILAPFIVYA